MRVSLISATVVFAVFASLAVVDSTNWDLPLQFCAKKALAVAEHSKCQWDSKTCYVKNEKYSANISKFMCSASFTFKKLSDFCCNDNVDDLNDIVKDASRSNRRRRSKHQKRASSSTSNEFDRWISSYIS